MCTVCFKWSLLHDRPLTSTVSRNLEADPWLCDFVGFHSGLQEQANSSLEKLTCPQSHVGNRNQAAYNLGHLLTVCVSQYVKLIYIWCFASRQTHLSWKALVFSSAWLLLQQGRIMTQAPRNEMTNCSSLCGLTLECQAQPLREIPSKGLPPCAWDSGATQDSPFLGQWQRNRRTSKNESTHSWDWSGHPIGQNKTGAEWNVNTETKFTFSWGDKTHGKAQNRGKDGAMASFSFKIYFV